MLTRPNLPDFDTESEAVEAGQRLIDLTLTQYPLEVGIHPFTQKYTLKLLLQRNGCYPVDVDGMYGFEGHSVLVLRNLPNGH